MSKKDRRALMVRNAILGTLAAIAVLVIGFGVYVGTPLSTPSEISDSDDVTEVENPRPRREGDPISVVEFFSYTCIHCKNFDPVIEEWAAEQPADVAFSRQPAMWSPIQIMLGQVYLTLAEEDALEGNHERIFRAIHDRRRQFQTARAVGEYIDGEGITEDEFVRAFNSPKVREAVRQAEADQRDFKISATPSIVVDGRYVVGMGGGAGRAIQILDKLVAQIRAENQPGS